MGRIEEAIPQKHGQRTSKNCFNSFPQSIMLRMKSRPRGNDTFVATQRYCFLAFHLTVSRTVAGLRHDDKFKNEETMKTHAHISPS